MLQYKCSVISFLFFVASLNILSAQNLEAIAKSSPFQVSGSIGLNLGYYQSFGIPSRQDNFTYLFSGNINPRILGLDMPVSVTYSQMETTFLQPFNQVGISPQYKWIKAHFGYRRMNFSPLTLNGHTFLGTGIELNPKSKKGIFNYRLTAMYGRLRRAIEPGDAITQQVSSAYKRMGYGVKFGVEGRKEKNNYIDLILFKAQDIINSIEAPVFDQTVKPQENLVLGISGQYRLLKKIILKVDMASSALTRDSRAEESAIKGAPIFGTFNGLFTNRISTQFKNSLKSTLTYSSGKYNIGLAYNRIPPGYQTLGSYYFQNDVEDYTVNASSSFKKGTIQVSGSFGLQRNNLENNLTTGSKRLISSMNYSQTFGKKLSVNASFSNFSSSLLVTKDELSDSLNLYQVSTNFMLSGNYNLGGTNSQQGIGLTLGHQIGNARDEYNISDVTTRFYNMALSYRLNRKEKNLGFMTAINYIQNNSPGIKNINIGPSIGINKKLLKNKISARYMISYLNNFNNGAYKFAALNNRVTVNYAFLKQNSLGLLLGVLSKLDKVDNDKSYNELRLNLNYQLRF